MNYNELTRRHFERAGRAGEIAGCGVRRGSAGGRAQGTWVQFDVRSDDLVREVRFLAFGCPHVIAVADWLAERAPGSPCLPLLPEPVSALQRRFAVPVEKLGRLLIIEDAWIAAVSAPYNP